MRILLILFLSIGLFCCTIPKDARILKKSAKQWRNSTVVLEAYADTPFSGLFLTLRENGKFEHISSGIIKSFEAGTWTNNADTLHLTYMDSRQIKTSDRKLIIDRKTSTLMADSASTPVQMRMRIFVNKLLGLQSPVSEYFLFN